MREIHLLPQARKPSNGRGRLSTEEEDEEEEDDDGVEDDERWSGVSPIYVINWESSAHVPPPESMSTLLNNLFGVDLFRTAFRFGFLVGPS